MFFAGALATLVVSAAVQTSYAAPAVFGEVAARTFSLNREATGFKRLRSGPLAVKRTYMKYNGKIPEHVRVATSIDFDGSVGAAPETFDSEYLCPVEVGTPKKTVYLDVDTGSSDMWIFTGQIPDKQWKGHKNYFPHHSKSAKKMDGESFTIVYGDQSGASGNLFADVVRVGPVTATSMAIEAATSVSAAFLSDSSLSGLMGLGGSINNQVVPTKQLTFFDTVKPQLAAPLFAAYLKHDATGCYDFGYLDPSHYTGSIYYTGAYLLGGYWQMTTTGYTVGTTTYPTPLTSIVDTGTTLIFMSDDVVTNYYSHVPGSENSVTDGGWIFPCSATPPDFGIVVDGSPRVVPGQYINYTPSSSISSTPMCFGGLQSGVGLPFNVLGDVFIKSQYIVFDEGSSRLGFAQQA